MIKHCKNCNLDFSNKDNFCDKCGKKLIKQGKMSNLAKDILIGLSIAIIIFTLLFLLFQTFKEDSNTEEYSQLELNEDQNVEVVEEEEVIMEEVSFGETNNAFYLGEPSAPVTINMFMDFECPYCARSWSTVNEIIDNYVNKGDVKLVFRHLPLSFHENAEEAVLASICAGKQDLFWEYADGLFENQDLISMNYFEELAEELDLNLNNFEQCMNLGVYNFWIENDKDLANDYGITGTPGFLVNGELIKGAQLYNTFETAIEAALEEENVVTE